MKINNDLKQEILKEISMPSYEDDDIIPSEEAERLGVTIKTIHSRMDKLVKSGRVKKFKGKLPNGLPGWIYRPIE